MAGFELVVLNGDHVGTRLVVAPGCYSVVRRAAEKFEAKATLIASHTEQWRLSQEDLELAAANLTLRAAEEGGVALSIDAFERSEDIALWDLRMSQPHAMVMCDQHRAMVVDMGSRNGTYVNGEKVGVAELAHGDLLRWGTTRIHVNLQDELPG